MKREIINEKKMAIINKSPYPIASDTRIPRLSLSDTNSLEKITVDMRRHICDD